MKIVIIGSKDFDSLEFHLADSLKFLGHEVYQIDIKDVVKIPYRFNYWSQKLFPKYDKYIFDNIAKEVVELRPDLVIGTYRFIHPDCITYIKKNSKNTKVIQVNPDALTTFEHQQVFASPYDAYFTKDPFIVDFMKNKMKLNVFYLPEAFNQRIHSYELEDRQSLENRLNTDVVCFGNMYPYRAKMVEALIDSDVNVKLYGVPDRRFTTTKISYHFQNEYITGERKAEVLIGSKIVFNNFHYAEVYSANAKYFEIAGMGAFQICDYKPTLDEYSGISTEKYTYYNIDEAIEKIDYYLDKPQERHTLAKQQREHFLNNHTYDIRMQQMLSMLGL